MLIMGVVLIAMMVLEFLTLSLTLSLTPSLTPSLTLSLAPSGGHALWLGVIFYLEHLYGLLLWLLEGAHGEGGILVLRHFYEHAAVSVWLVMAVAALVKMAYFGFLTSSRWQATLGMMVMNCIVVTHHHHRRVSFWRGLAWLWAQIVSLLPFAMGYIMMMVHPHRRGLHDIIAGVVVRHRSLN